MRRPTASRWCSAVASIVAFRGAVAVAVVVVGMLLLMPSAFEVAEELRLHWCSKSDFKAYLAACTAKHRLATAAVVSAASA